MKIYKIPDNTKEIMIDDSGSVYIQYKELILAGKGWILVQRSKKLEEKDESN